MSIAKRNDPFPFVLFSEEERMEAGFAKAGIRGHSEGEFPGFLQKAFSPEQSLAAEKNEYPMRSIKIDALAVWAIDTRSKRR